MLADDDATVVAINPLEDDLADIVVRLRSAVKMTQKQLAEKLNVSPQYVNDLEHRRRLGSVQFVEAVCDEFAASPEWRGLFHRVAARGHGWDV